MDRGNLTDLAAFVAVADRLSLRAAAAQLSVTPSAQDDWPPSFEGQFHYNPGHRQVPATLLTLIDNDPHGPRLGIERAVTSEPFYQGLSE